MNRFARRLESRSTPRRQRGAVAIMVAFAILMLLAFLGLAIETYHLVVVKAELQNDADAAALAGADHFFVGTPLPNTALAVEKGEAAIALNRTMDGPLSTGTVEAGYWNPTAGFGTTQVASTDPLALRVEVRRAEGENGGPVSLWFGWAIGMPTAPMAARAVAISTPPGMVWPGNLFPMVMTQCTFDDYWDVANNRPRNDPATGKPYIFDVYSSYHSSETCQTGQWTSFQLNRNDTATIRVLLEEGNSEPIGIGDPTWLEPGTKTAIYYDVDDCSARGDRTCEYVSVPVIEANKVTTHATTDVSGFACMRILKAEGGSSKYVQVQMATGCKADGEGGGTYYGTATPAKLSH